MMGRGGGRAQVLEREFMGNGMGGSGGGYPQVQEFGMREAMMEADQRMEWKRMEEMEREREAARFKNSYGDTGVTFDGRGRGRRSSFYQGQDEGGGGRRGSFDGHGGMGMSFNNGKRSYDGGFGGGQNPMGGGAREDMGHYGRGLQGGSSGVLPPPHSSIGGGVRGSDGLVRSTTGAMGKAGRGGDLAIDAWHLYKLEHFCKAFFNKLYF